MLSHEQRPTGRNVPNIQKKKRPKPAGSAIPLVSRGWSTECQTPRVSLKMVLDLDAGPVHHSSRSHEIQYSREVIHQLSHRSSSLSSTRVLDLGVEALLWILAWKSFSPARTLRGSASPRQTSGCCWIHYPWWSSILFVNLLPCCLSVDLVGMLSAAFSAWRRETSDASRMLSSCCTCKARSRRPLSALQKSKLFLSERKR